MMKDKQALRGKKSKLSFNISLA